MTILLQTIPDHQKMSDALYNYDPLIGVIGTMFIIAVGYLVWQGREKDKKILEKEKEIAELNSEVRELAAANVQVISTLSHLAEKMIGGMDSLSKDVKTQLEFQLSKIIDYMDRIKDLHDGK